MREKGTLMCATALLVLTVTPLGSAPGDWPPFLRPSDEYPAQVARAVGRLWTDATFTRTVSADPAPVPLSFYLRFVDAPDLTAAAARHLGLTTYDIKALGDDWYEVENGDSVHGVYRVLVRDGGRRILLSWGSHRGSILGTVGGSALTQLEFADDRGRAAQRLAVNVIIDHGGAATITRAIVPLFGWFVDRKLTEAFRTTAAAAAWAHARPDEFCTWLGGVLTADRRRELLDVFDECASRFPQEHRGRQVRLSRRLPSFQWFLVFRDHLDLAAGALRVNPLRFGRPAYWTLVYPRRDGQAPIEGSCPRCFASAGSSGPADRDVLLDSRHA